MTVHTSHHDSLCMPLNLMQASRPHAAADAAAKGAKLLQEHNTKTSTEAAFVLYERAMGVLEDSGHADAAGDLYRQAIAAMVAGNKLDSAAIMLLRFAAACDPTIAAATVQKCFLSAIVVQLAGDAIAAAWATYQDALEVPTFATSAHARVAESLFDAYQSGEEAAVQAAVKAHAGLLMDLDTCVVRLVKTLPTAGGIAVAAQALGEVQGDGEPDLR